jgi:hypothetical protein
VNREMKPIEGHSITISEETHHALMHTVERMNNEETTRQAKDGNFTNMINAMIAGTIDMNLCVQCGRKLEKRWCEEKDYSI